MKTKIYSLICIVVSVVMCILLSACSTQVSSGDSLNDNGSELNENNVYDATQDNDSDYMLISDNGEFLIIFDDLNSYQVDNQETATIDFATMKEFKDSVTKGLLTDTQKRIMATAFQKNDTGAILTCDFNNLYVPKLPSSGSFNGVSWEGQTYSFDLTLNDSVFGWLTYLTESQYNNKYQEDYLNYFDKDTITVTNTETLEGEKVATYYTTRAGQLMNLRYSLTVGEKVIVVDKTFRLQMNNSDIVTSSTVPSNIALYCTSDEGFCYVSLYNFTNDPTDEWLMNFGLQKYVDNGYAVK